MKLAVSRTLAQSVPEFFVFFLDLSVSPNEKTA